MRFMTCSCSNFMSNTSIKLKNDNFLKLRKNLCVFVVNKIDKTFNSVVNKSVSPCRTYDGLRLSLKVKLNLIFKVVKVQKFEQILLLMFLNHLFCKVFEICFSSHDVTWKYRPLYFKFIFGRGTGVTFTMNLPEGYTFTIVKMLNFKINELNVLDKRDVLH